MHSTSRLGINIPDPGDSVSLGPADFAQAFGVLDAALLYGQGPLANRPPLAGVPRGYAYKCTDVPAIFLSDSATWHYVPVDGGASPIAAVEQYAGTSDPVDPDGVTRWMVCDGRTLSRSQFTGLFGVLGTTWGNGDSSGTTFSLPNLLGRVAVGANPTGAGGLSARTVGQTGGEEAHVLSVAELALHSHTATSATTGISIVSAATGGTINNAYTGVSTMSVSTGITLSDPGHVHHSGQWSFMVSDNAFASNVWNNPQSGHTPGVYASDFTIWPQTAGASTGMWLNDPSHGHPMNDPQHSHYFNDPGHGHSVADPGHSHPTTSTGSGTAHNNMQPFGVLNHIIRVL